MVAGGVREAAACGHTADGITHRWSGPRRRYTALAAERRACAAAAAQRHSVIIAALVLQTPPRISMSIPAPLPRLNPSDEIIQAGPVTLRFLVTGSDSGGSVAVFEFMVPAG